jgi:hypothetical protein
MSLCGEPPCGQVVFALWGWRFAPRKASTLN